MVEQSPKMDRPLPEKREDTAAPPKESLNTAPALTPLFRGLFSRLFRLFRRTGFQAFLLFALLWIIYNSNARLIGGSDCYAARFLPINLVLYGNYHYDKLSFLRGEDGKGGMPGGMLMQNTDTPSDGHVITFYPVLIPTLLVPFYYIPFKLMGISPESYLPFYMDKWFMGAFVAGAAVFLFLSLARVGVGFRGRLLLTLSCALGTSMWAISSQAFWQHAPSAFFLAFSLYLLLRLRESTRLIGPLGLVTGLAAGTRPTNAMWFMLVAAYIFIYLLENRKGWWRVIWYFVWASPVVIFNLWYNKAYFGSCFTSGYDFNPVNRYIPDFLHIHNFPSGLRGLLISTSLGLLPNAPFFIFIIPAFFLGMRRRPSRGPRLLPLNAHFPFFVPSRMVGTRHGDFPALGIRRIMWIFCAAHLLLYSCYREWWAGYSYAYRYLTDIMPLLCFLLFPLLSWKPFRCGGLGVYLVFLLWAMAIQFYGAFCWSGALWFGKHWKNLTRQLLINPETLKRGRPFGKHSVHWSLEKEEHYIGMELKFFRYSDKWWLTPEKMKSDLSRDRKVPYGVYAPIILPFGEKVD